MIRMGRDTGVDRLSIRLVAQSLPAVKLIGLRSLSAPEVFFFDSPADALDALDAREPGKLSPACCLIACSCIALCICSSSGDCSRLADPPEDPDDEAENRFDEDRAPPLVGLMLPSTWDPPP